MAIISCGNRALPRDLDVSVQVSLAQTEAQTDLSVMVAAVNDPPFDHGSDRVQFYSSIEAVEDAGFASTSEGWKMANAFFSQSPRAQTMAIGGIYTTAQAGFMKGGTITASAATFAAIANGSFTISIDGDEQDITAIDFSGDATLTDVAATIQTALQAVATGGYTAATVSITNNQLRITSGTTGNSSTVSALSAVSPASGTDLSVTSLLNARDTVASITDGYTPTTIDVELGLIAEAARCGGRFVYGWALEASYRDTADQVTASTWAQARTAIMALQSNSVTAYDSGSTSDIGYVLNASGDFRTFVVWAPVTNIDEYPEVALLSYMLHVNYRAANSTVTAKFKNLVGITPSGITETQLTVLENKRYNVFTRVGNTARTLRDGTQADNSWFMDDLINLDNGKEFLQTEVYNVFLREPKVPYTVNGTGKIYRAIETISTLFTLNGTLADRPVADTSRESGERIDPAYTIDFTRLSLISTSDRASRIGPPFTVKWNLAGAIHSVAIQVNAYS